MALPEEPIAPKVLRRFICPYVPSSLFDCGMARSGAKLATACPYKHLVEDTKFDEASKKYRGLAAYYLLIGGLVYESIMRMRN